MAPYEHQVWDARLGERVVLFKPLLVNAYAGLIVSAIFILGGSIGVYTLWQEAARTGWQLPVFAERGWSWTAVGMLCLVGIGFVIAGFAIAAYSRRLLLGGVLFCTNGLRIYSHLAPEDVLWSEIDRIEERKVYQSSALAPMLVKHLLPKVGRTDFVVETVDGRKYEFDESRIHALDRFREYLQKQARRESICWEESKLSV